MDSNSSRTYFGEDLCAMSFAENYHRWILSEFKPYLGKKVAEIGAGTGSFSKLLLESSIATLSAYEPSKNMFPLLQKNLSNDPRAKVINDFFSVPSSDRFDTIVYVNVLEHIENDSAELDIAHKALDHSGHLLLFVPALSWLYGSMDRQVGHVRRYHKANLKARVQRAGFKILFTRYFDFIGIIPWYINFVLLQTTLGNRSVKLYDHLVVPWLRWIEHRIPPPIGKNLLLVASNS
ncbi:MAG TPA: class I SAM-dependent methyltransferase [Candidatus Ozemobacteraceae bacterium]|mgnify:CR=1 FL=1|nr:class I SAM-dependent methyltransferase [Candidatus Ozemobacteraceae bacterium]